MKLFKLLFLLLITLSKAYSQEASIKHINFLPVSEQVKNSQNLNHQRALPFMQKPYELLNYWGDQTLPIAQYSEKEKAFQQHLNHVLSADFVLSYSPEGVAFEEDNYSLPLNERNIDNEPITPYTWKWVRFELIHEDGSKDEVKLCRPNWWLNNLGANKVGEKVYLDVPETGINGTAQVIKIQPCQLDTRFLHEKREGEYVYRPITATFKHQSAEVWNFTFTGDETVGATNNHPFYSLDRQDYIPVGELRIGERVKNFVGTEIKLLSKAKRPNPEPVYNLEVYRDHNYLVGKGKILVHNNCLTALLGDIKRWVHTEFNAQGLAKIQAIEQRLLANDPFVWQEPIYTTLINGKRYLLDGHHRIQAAININYTGEIPHIDIPIAEIGTYEGNGGIYKTAQDVINASKVIR